MEYPEVYKIALESKIEELEDPDFLNAKLKGLHPIEPKAQVWMQA
jgi:hypothetical protein